NNAPILPVHIPFARPYAGQKAITDLRPEDPHFSHVIRGEWTLLAFAEEHKLDYGVFTDRDIFKGGKVFDADIVVFNLHSEYWSNEMLAALHEYIAKGGKVVFSGGNNIYQKIRYNQYGMELIEPYTAKKISPIIGTFFSEQVYPMFSSYKVKNKDNWIFRDTGIKNGDKFGAVSLNHRHEEKINGASGWEADQANKYSKGFEVLASGTNKTGAAHMVLQNTGNGGWIFNASSIPFTGAIFTDKVVSKIMLNLLTYK
ncbi:MAG: hypothetical protein HOK72_12630, partial [Flavobacteriales bacterium]|nr:hypothetical protein [Flavobacteriales bacterium]